MEMKLIRRRVFVFVFLCIQLTCVLTTKLYFRRPGPTLKEWSYNTNFDNLDNWQGLRGYENCSKNIYSFPSWYDQQNVIMFPAKTILKQIILPVNGHFIFQEGINKFLSKEQDTCRGREVQFSRANPADWFEPDKWYAHVKGDNEKRGSSLLNAKSSSSKAVAHVERVPCHYDSVRFPANSTFSLKISENVTISKFYLGDKVQSYTDVAILMNSPLGKLQFLKLPETIFSITDNGEDEKNKANNNNNKISENSGESISCQRETQDGDSDLCICSNYKDWKTRQKICSLTKCDTEGNTDEEICPNPLTPHGFCCPICGIHVKIRHSGRLRLIPLYGKLEAELGRQNLQGKVYAHLARYKEKAAHLVLVPEVDTSAQVLGQIQNMVREIQKILKIESEVIGMTVIESWGGVYPSGGNTDRLEGGSLGGGAITLLALLGIVVLLGGIALAIFLWNKKNGYPPLSLSSVTSSLPRMSIGSIRIPIVAGAGRRSSTLSSSLQNFGFARFTNERVSSVTIGAAGESSGGGGDGGAGAVKKSSSIRRAEEVDDQVPEKVSDANSGAFGFTNVTYDLVAGVKEKTEEVKPEEAPHAPSKPKREIPPIPEIKIKDVDEPPIIQEKKAPPPPIASTSGTESTLSPLGKETKQKEGKGKLPAFVASRFAKAYQKLGPDEAEDAHEVGKVEPEEGKQTQKVNEPAQDVSNTAQVQELPVRKNDDETLVNLEE